MSRDCFAALDETDQCKAIELLGLIPCVASGYLSARCTNDEIKDPKCLLCEGSPLPDSVERDELKCREISSEAILTFSNLIKSPNFGSSKRPRILAMYMLRKFALHYDNPEFLDLEMSPLGQWCLGSLKSSLRELRIAAG
jgi:serine/threonine-protein kinase ATR